MPTAKTVVSRWCRQQGVRFSVPVPGNKELILCLKGTSLAHVVSEYTNGGRKELSRSDYREIIKHCHAVLKGDNVKVFSPKVVREKRHVERKAFYESREWLELRYKVLTTYGRRCMCCGATPEQGVVLHVDHIKPRSKFPHLALTFTNLQVLCESCNMGKSNKSQEDFRPADAL